MSDLFGAASTFQPKRIVSGGQTGVDRAALDTAMELDIEHGGWCPAGRLAEDGIIPVRYKLAETKSSEYPVRTEQNIVDSSATLILHEGKIRGGTRLTRRLCKKLEKPFFTVKISLNEVASVRRWLDLQAPETLNIAGPRESSSPGIYSRSLVFLARTFSVD